MTIKLKLIGISEVEGTLKLVGGAVEKRTILGLSQVAFDEAQQGAGRHNKTGALFQSLYNRSAGPSSRAVGHDTNRAPHAGFVQLGTRPHTIKPNKKKALRFVVGNKFAFAGSVKHPGYKGDGYLIKAATTALQSLSQIIDRAFKEIT